MRPVRLLSVLVALGALLATACGSGSPASKPVATGSGAPAAQSAPAARPSFAADSYMARIQQRGNLIAGVKYDTPPFGSLNPINNQIEGFDADLARALARAIFGDAGKVQFLEAISRNRIPFLQEDKVDVILSTMTITDERKGEIDFSDVYYM